MDVIHSVAALRERLQREPNNVFVPTMGNLHAGHIQLINIAKPRAACTVVSIFVNRLQFGPREDFERYPRTLEADCDKLRAAGVDVVFAPDEKEIYPQPQTYVVEPSNLQHILDGAARPGHFRGVSTVVLKLFNMVSPHAAIFGKKDYQQCLVLTNMVRQLALPIELILAETVRAPDGLALSSRNAYLSAENRTRAAILPAAMKKAIAEIAASKPVGEALTRLKAALLASGFESIDYAELRDATNFAELAEQPGRPARLLVAARIGGTRLSDNMAAWSG